MKNPDSELHQQFAAHLAERNPMLRQQRINQTVDQLKEALTALVADNQLLQQQNTDLRNQLTAMTVQYQRMAETVEVLTEQVIMFTGGADDGCV